CRKHRLYNDPYNLLAVTMFLNEGSQNPSKPCPIQLLPVLFADNIENTTYHNYGKASIFQLRGQCIIKIVPVAVRQNHKTIFSSGIRTTLLRNPITSPSCHTILCPSYSLRKSPTHIGKNALH
ncbi:MAG TPA: hypothetical protein VGB84_05750, partial [Arachidicoccus sp.]